LVVTVVVLAFVERNDRVIVAVVKVLRRRRLVVVVVAVGDASETAGLCRVADPAVPRKLRIRADWA
jgi:hypothetical protein